MSQSDVADVAVSDLHGDLQAFCAWDYGTTLDI